MQGQDTDMVGRLALGDSRGDSRVFGLGRHGGPAGCLSVGGVAESGPGRRWLCDYHLSGTDSECPVRHFPP